jgi:PIN domain nuclease of toxin-antitoxin system
MIILDTHIWIWWVNQAGPFTAGEYDLLKQSEAGGLGVSVISCWEVAMLVAKGRLNLMVPVEKWVKRGLRYPGIRLLPISPTIAVSSMQLKGEFHGDPADRLIVATAISRRANLLTHDGKIKKYPHVGLVA